MKIGAKIYMGFACIGVLLLAIAVMSIASSVYTGANIDEIDIYSGLQLNANNVMNILNETRISARVFYQTHTDTAFSDVDKQLMYCDLQLKKLMGYLDANPECAGYKEDINKFSPLYNQWTAELKSMSTEYDLAAEFTAAQEESFAAKAQTAYLANLQAHEILSNTIADIDYDVNKKMQATKNFSFAALVIVIIISVLSLAAAAFLAVIIIRSITKPISYMRDALVQIGQSGDLRIDPERLDIMHKVADGKDESAQCTHALLVLVDKLNDIGDKLSSVAAGDLTVKSALQSDNDTMGLAVDRMLVNLNQKFGTIAQSTLHVNGKAGQLFEGSQLLASGSQLQSESVGDLSNSVLQASKKTEEITDFAKQATALAGNIESSAKIGTEKMNQMIQATKGINEASQAIGKVIKVIDDIAFQTNILALNAAVEAARAGQHGKGFAVVADEVRSLANKSAEAAKDTGVLIEDTMQRAALGESIAEDTSKSLGDIVNGVEQSNALIGNMALLSQEQSNDIRRIIDDVERVEKIVEQNSTIATQSATATRDISEQFKLLQDLVAQFQLAGEDRYKTNAGGMTIEKP